MTHLPIEQQPPTGGASRFVLRVGLTGGIATGKTTVARTFAALGATVIDADEIAHSLLERGAAAHERVVEAFGRDILRGDGSVDRARLGRIVFADADRRRLLESILHPLIRAEGEARIVRQTRSGSRIAVSNAALLVEAGLYREYDRLVVTHCAPEVQVERLVVRDGMPEEQARARIAAQMPSAEKIRVAHYTIDTGDGFAQTEMRARAIYRHLQFDLQALAPRF
jgi:dephospho-CoA kinase